MADVVCFWCDRAGVADESLRRYAGDKECPLPHGYHDASVLLGEVPWTAPETRGHNDDDIAHDDSRWPASCACGYLFQPTDTWQHNIVEKLRRVDTGETFITMQAPPGAMFDAWWLKPFGVGPDGRALMVMLPDGNEWHVDGPAKNSKTSWQRSGEPPKITASPSIQTPKYHGHLVDGVLRPC